MFLQVRNGTGAVVKNADRSFQTADIASRSTGAITADYWLASLRVKSLAGTISDLNTWSPSNLRYYLPNAGPFAMYTMEQCRDQLWEGWMRVGWAFLRMQKKSNGKYRGIRLAIQEDETKGRATIEYVDDYVDHNTSATVYTLFSCDQMTDTASTGSYSYTDYFHADSDTGFVLTGSGASTGYNKSNTTGKLYKVVLQGFDIYLYYNNVLFWQGKQYFMMDPGFMAVTPATGGVVRDCTFQRLARKATDTDQLGKKGIDLRDWYCKPNTATGNISSGSNSLVVSNSLNVVPGDYVIVAVGGESSTGPGTKGVGGYWPPTSYANSAAMVAARDSDLTGGAFWNGADLAFCSLDSTGNCYRWVSGFASNSTLTNGSTTVTVADTSWMTVGAEVTANVGGVPTNTTIASITNATTLVLSAAFTGTTTSTATLTIAQWTQYTGSGYWYLKKRVPKALVSRVTAVSVDQLTITLADNAVVGATGANVYVDHSFWLYKILNLNQYNAVKPSNFTVHIPRNCTLAIGHPNNYYIGIAGAPNWTFKGSGRDISGIIVPKGCNSSIGAVNSAGPVIQDLQFEGNHALSGFSPPLDPYGLAFDAYGIRIQTSSDAIIQNTRVKNSMKSACELFTCSGASKIYNNDVVHETPTQNYLSHWKLEMANCTGSPECSYNTVTCSHVLEPGMEAFQTTNGHYHHNTLINCNFSSNSADNITFEENDITIHAYAEGGDDFNTWLPDMRLYGGPLKNQSIFEISNTINGQQGSAHVASGGTYRNNNVTIEGPINASGDFMDIANIAAGSGYLFQGNFRANGVSSHTGNERGYIHILGWTDPSSPGCGIRQDGTGGTIVRGMRIKYEGASTMNNNSRKQIGLGVPSGATSIVEDCIVDADAGVLRINIGGAGTIVNQRNISNAAFEAGG